MTNPADTQSPDSSSSSNAASKKSRAAVKPKKAKKTVQKTTSPQASDDSKTIIRQVIISTVIMLLLLGSAVAVTQQINQYRQSFAHSQQLRTKQKQLNTEWHKLLLEQQTFGATTRIGGRAVVSMGMYSPKPSEVITVNVVGLDKPENP